MSFNLLDSVKGLFNDDVISKAASSLGENENNLQKAMGGILPSVLTGVLSKAGSGDAGSILGMAKDAAGSGILGNLGGVLGGGGSNLLNKGGDMLKSLFGDKAGNIVNMISNFAGIKESSASSLMNMAAPAALGVIGKHASETNMSAGGLLSLLNSQKDSILNSLPSGLNLAGALGLSSLGNIGSKLSGALSGISGNAKNVTGRAMSSVEKTRGGMGWFWPLVLVAAAVGLIWYFMKGCNSSTVKQEVNTMMDTVVTNVPPVETSMLKVKLPDGVELDAYTGGVEDQLVTFLNDPSTKAGKDVWFDFDNLNFKTGSSDLTDESMMQVKNMVAILKAYPTLEIKIGGYTDRTGDSTSNLKLSQARAAAVAGALKTAGANTSQLTGAEGYGSQFAKVAADASDEERKKDRRIAISVRRK